MFAGRHDAWWWWKFLSRLLGGNELGNLGLNFGLRDGLGEYFVLSLNDFPERAQDTGHRVH